MKSICTLLASIAAVSLIASAAQAEEAKAAPAAAEKKMEMPKAATNPAFEKMKTMIGEWNAETPMGPTKVAYKMASNDSVLVETMNGGTKMEMITVYYADKDQVALTHYCSAGNQPRMRTKKAGTDKLDFEFVDVTNAADKKAGYMNGLTLSWKDADHVTALWKMKGNDTPHAFELTRSKSTGS